MGKILCKIFIDNLGIMGIIGILYRKEYYYGRMEIHRKIKQ